MTITHHCDDCGSEITSDCCPDHPEADILSVGPYTAQEPGFGGLYEYKTGTYLRQATAAEAAKSVKAAASDIGGGSGVIEIDGLGLCYIA